VRARNLASRRVLVDECQRGRVLSWTPRLTLFDGARLKSLAPASATRCYAAVTLELRCQRIPRGRHTERVMGYPQLDRFERLRRVTWDTWRDQPFRPTTGSWTKALMISRQLSLVACPGQLPNADNPPGMLPYPRFARYASNWQNILFAARTITTPSPSRLTVVRISSTSLYPW
jgi:hypothetical protein